LLFFVGGRAGPCFVGAIQFRGSNNRWRQRHGRVRGLGRNNRIRMTRSQEIGRTLKKIIARISRCRILWEPFLLAKLGACRSRRNGDRRRREKYQNS
jgi:hypothetical protein